MTIAYSKKVIGFIDILGFKEMLKESENLPVLVNYLQKMKEIFDRPVFERGFDRYLKYEIKQISDSIIITADIKDSFDLSLFFQKIGQHLGESIVKNDVIIRGAVAYGDHYCEDSIFISPAFVDAYELEKKADYPRVVISNSVLDLLESFIKNDNSLREWFKPFLGLSEDGMTFVNYLHFLSLLNKKFLNESRSNEMKDRLNLFNSHKLLIENNLKKFENNSYILKKYVWLARYHNHFLLQMQDSWLSRCVIDKELIDKF